MLLQTERLTLRSLDPDEAPQVVDYLLRNRAFFEPWSPAVDESYYTVDYQRERLLRELTLLHEDRGYRLWLFKREDSPSARIIGDLAFSNIVRGAFQSCHLGYKIDQADMNSGYMTEALKEALRFAFGKLRLHRVEANIMPRNARSIRVVEKLGFTCEGLSRKYLKINGVWEDHLHYVLLNDDLE